MNNIIEDKDLIAYCGLYCGACGAYLKEKCPGCKKNTKASWCKVRACCIENSYLSCADCNLYPSTVDCKRANNIISKIFSVIFGSDRPACVRMIKEKGYHEFAKYMADNKLQSIKKRRGI